MPTPFAISNLPNDEMYRLLSSLETRFPGSASEASIKRDAVFGIVVLAMRLHCHFESDFAIGAWRGYCRRLRARSGCSSGQRTPQQADAQEHVVPAFPPLTSETTPSSARVDDYSFESTWIDPSLFEGAYPRQHKDKSDCGTFMTLYEWVEQFKRDYKQPRQEDQTLLRRETLLRRDRSGRGQGDRSRSPPPI